MKQLILIALLMFSSTSSAEWTKVMEDSLGNTHYIDFDRIRVVDGYVYFWDITDTLKPELTFSSSSAYRQVDCKLFRDKLLSIFFHKEPMAGGTGRHVSPTGEYANWYYPTPESVRAKMLLTVCNHVK